jgi:hypothetical protein
MPDAKPLSNSAENDDIYKDSRDDRIRPIVVRSKCCEQLFQRWRCAEQRALAHGYPLPAVSIGMIPDPIAGGIETLDRRCRHESPDWRRQHTRRVLHTRVVGKEALAFRCKLDSECRQLQAQRQFDGVGQVIRRLCGPVDRLNLCDECLAIALPHRPAGCTVVQASGCSATRPAHLDHAM